MGKTSLSPCKSQSRFRPLVPDWKSEGLTLIPCKLAGMRCGCGTKQFKARGGGVVPEEMICSEGTIWIQNINRDQEHSCEENRQEGDGMRQDSKRKENPGEAE